MNSFPDVILYSLIGSISILPAVYAIALNALGANAVIRRAKEADLISESIEILNNAISASTSNQQTLSDIQNTLDTQKKREKQINRISRNLTFRSAFIEPGVVWAVALVLASLAKFCNFGGYGWINGILIGIATLLLLAGYFSTSATLRAAQLTIESFVPKLKLHLSEPYETEDSINGSQPYTLQIDVVVENTSYITAKNVHVDIVIPEQGIITPVLKPKDVIRSGQTAKIGYTPSFDVSSNDNYKHFVLIRPVVVGQHSLTFRPRCENFVGHAQTVQFTATKTA